MPAGVAQDDGAAGHEPRVGDALVPLPHLLPVLGGVGLHARLEGVVDEQHVRAAARDRPPDAGGDVDPPGLGVPPGRCRGVARKRRAREHRPVLWASPSRHARRARNPPRDARPYAVAITWCAGFFPRYHAGNRRLASSVFECRGGATIISRLHSPRATRSKAPAMRWWCSAVSKSRFVSSVYATSEVRAARTLRSYSAAARSARPVTATPSIGDDDAATHDSHPSSAHPPRQSPREPARESAAQASRKRPPARPHAPRPTCAAHHHHCANPSASRASTPQPSPTPSMMPASSSTRLATASTLDRRCVGGNSRHTTPPSASTPPPGTPTPAPSRPTSPRTPPSRECPEDTPQSPSPPPSTTSAHDAPQTVPQSPMPHPPQHQTTPCAPTASPTPNSPIRATRTRHTPPQFTRSPCSPSKSCFGAQAASANTADARTPQPTTPGDAKRSRERASSHPPDSVRKKSEKSRPRGERDPHSPPGAGAAFYTFSQPRLFRVRAPCCTAICA